MENNIHLCGFVMTNCNWANEAEQEIGGKYVWLELNWPKILDLRPCHDKRGRRVIVGMT